MLAQLPLSPLRPTASAISGTVASATPTAFGAAGAAADGDNGCEGANGTPISSPPQWTTCSIFSLGHRKEKSQSTGATLGRPAKKPVIPCAIDEPGGKISRPSTSRASWSRWRAPILSTTSRLSLAAAWRQGPYMLSEPSTSIEVSEK